MTKEEMLANLEVNRNSYENDGGLGLSYFFISNPVTDSLVVNAYAKTSKTAFEFALNTGVGYGNHTAFGGNFLYNMLYNNKFTGEKLGIRKLNSGVIRPFEKIPMLNKIQPLRNFSLNFVSSNELEGAGKIVSEYAEQTGLNKTSEIVRTGFGFGKNYNEFFSALKETGFNLNGFYSQGNQYVGQAINRRTVSSYIKNMNQQEYKNFIKYVDESMIKKVDKVKNSKKALVNNSIVQSFQKFVSENKELAGLEWNQASLKGEVIKHINSLDDEGIKKIANSFLKFGGKLEHYDDAAKIVSKEVKEELAEAIGARFARRGIFEKIISNPLVRVVTGAAVALPASATIAIAAVTTGIGIVAQSGQANAINNFLNSNLYNTSQYDNYSSDEANMAMYSASNIRDANLQALYNSYSKINVANRYLNDMDPISSDYSYKLSDAETA